MIPSVILAINDSRKFHLYCLFVGIFIVVILWKSVGFKEVIAVSCHNHHISSSHDFCIVD